MALVLNMCLLILVTCQRASSQEHTTRTHTITAGSGTGSLTDYLHSASQVFSSFTTLLFSPGVHDMCEDSVVVIRDVTNIALIGSETTATKSVQVSDGEVVDVTEPSTVIDCHGCPTGFVFTNVSELSVKRITLTQCGGYFVNYTVKKPFRSTHDSQSSLTIVAVQNLTLLTVSFRNSRGNYSLIAINVYGESNIENTSILQEVSLFSAYQQGNVHIMYTNTLKENSVLNTLSVIFLYTTNGLGDVSWPNIGMDIFSCHHDIKIYLKHITVHIAYCPRVFGLRKAIIDIHVSKDASNFQIDMQRVRLSGTQQNIIVAYALYLLYSEKVLECPTSSTTTVGVITVTDLKASEYYGVRLLAQMPLKNNYHVALFDQCELSGFKINDFTEPSLKTYLDIIIRNTTMKYKNDKDQRSLMYAYRVRHLVIESCNFLHSWGGSGLYLHDGAVHFEGSITFYNNTAEYGGGILMTGSESALYLSPNTTLNFTNNTALITGGALHIETRDGYNPSCFIQLTWVNFSLPDVMYNTKQQGIYFYFVHNSAGIAGTVIWGGSLEKTCIINAYSHHSAFLPSIFNVVNNRSGLSAISSSPQDLCYCNGTLECTSSPWRRKIYGPSFTLYPGQSLEVEIAIAGQLSGLVTGLVQAELEQTSGINVRLGKLQETQRIDHAECTVLVYTTFSFIDNTKTQLHLFLVKTTAHESKLLDYTDDVADRPLTSQAVSITSSVTLKNCPIGFQHNQPIGSCTCLRALLHYMDNTSCDINTQTVQRTPTFWINASFTGNNTQILAVHQHCSFDYCDPNKHRLDLSYPDQQCAHNRSGTLCGGCRRGLSLTLGSPKCKQCSNRYLSLLLVFPLAGIALVAVLTCLNLTVSVGTINGLILYANIIRAIHPVFFPSTNFLSVFVAWMNLDIGMESCLYDGMDFFGLTWLQFLFPVYIWLLVSIMIITSHYSTTAAKLVSRDAVKVLATLFLLSYAKLLRTIITVLSFTHISYEDSNGTTYWSAVWLYDGNVGFVEGKHIPLFLVAISFGVFYIIPFTFLLLLAPFLQARSHRYRALRWVNKLMPFLDAYQGPYNSRFRFWSGLLLVARVVLFVGFALNILGNPQINLMLIITVLISLFSLQWLLGLTLEYAMLYNKKIVNFIEAFYLCNLGVLSTWSLLQLDSNASSRQTQTIITSVCVGLAFLVWVCILAYHTYLWLTGIEYVTYLWQKIKDRGHPADEKSDSLSPQADVQKHSKVVRKTCIELRESLLTDH